VINTQSGSTSQAGGSDSGSTVFSFSVTTSTIGYSGDSEWMLDTGATYHVVPMGISFLGYSVVMSDDCLCNIKGIGTIFIKMFNRMVWELKEVRYVPQLKKNLISVGALKALDVEVSTRDGVLKMTRGSMVILKGV